MGWLLCARTLSWRSIGDWESVVCRLMRRRMKSMMASIGGWKLERVATLAALGENRDCVGGIGVVDALFVDDRFAGVPAVGACFVVCASVVTAVLTHLSNTSPLRGVR
jgi:hypothetical protein